MTIAKLGLRKDFSTDGWDITFLWFPNTFRKRLSCFWQWQAFSSHFQAIKALLTLIFDIGENSTYTKKLFNVVNVKYINKTTFQISVLEY